MNTFLTDSLPYGFSILTGAMVVIFIVTFFLVRGYYLSRQNKLEKQTRSRERAIADLEAQEAQINDELDELRKAEAILIHRNGVLEGQIQEYTLLCAKQQQKIMLYENYRNQ